MSTSLLPGKHWKIGKHVAQWDALIPFTFHVFLLAVFPKRPKLPEASRLFSHKVHHQHQHVPTGHPMPVRWFSLTGCHIHSRCSEALMKARICLLNNVSHASRCCCFVWRVRELSCAWVKYKTHLSTWCVCVCFKPSKVWSCFDGAASETCYGKKSFLAPVAVQVVPPRSGCSGRALETSSIKFPNWNQANISKHRTYGRQDLPIKVLTCQDEDTRCASGDVLGGVMSHLALRQTSPSPWRQNSENLQTAVAMSWLCVVNRCFSCWI